MGALASFLERLFSKAAEYMVDTTAAQLSYVFKDDIKFRNLWDKVEELKRARQRVQQSVDETKRNGEEVFDDVERWLTVVNEKISDQATTQSQEDENKAMENYFAGFLRDIKNRYQLSKKADEEVEAITQLLNEKDRFDRVSYRSAVGVIDIIRPLKEYETFESRSGAFHEVMAALEDDNVNIIGVYGMGGVGKTTLVKEVASQVIAKEKKLFDEVVLVAITQTPNMVNIQDEIAEMLGLKIEERNVNVRAARLRDRLKKINNVLIILDDIWVTLDLEALGIPSADDHKGCKILTTSRRQEVLKSMGSQKILPIELLKEDEAWKLFKNLAGPIAERSDFQPTAEKVAQKCARLPIAIATVAKALKHKKDLNEWKDALERELSGNVHSAIEMSYNYLEREELKETFLLCSIMGHNAATEDLLKYCRGLGLFRVLDTIEKVRRVLTLVSELKDSSLLLAGSTPERFDMHDVVCEVATAIASRDRGWLASGKEDVSEEWSDKDRMRTCSLVSLQNTEVSELPDESECPKLTFFSMGSENSSSKILFSTDGVDSSLKIPRNLFEGMKGLKVLNFTRMNLTSLPCSIGCLKTLCTLRFVDCALEDIVMLGELVNLEILDLRESTISVLPKEIGQLRRLKLLDLSGCSKLDVISPNVLSSLSRLEELYLYDSFNRWHWEVEGSENNPRRNASLVELQNLSRLTTLEVHVPDVRAIPKQKLFSGNMERYKITIGDDQRCCFGGGMKTSRMLKLTTNNISPQLAHEIKTLLRRTRSLYLAGVEDAIKKLYDPITEGCPHLKHLGQVLFLAPLETLVLRSINGIEKIWHDDQLLTVSLRHLTVWSCPKLKCVFTSSMVESFVNLKTLVVGNCDVIEDIIEGILGGEERSSNSIRVFPKLDSVELFNLPNLKTFCRGINPIEFPLLRTLHITGCPLLSTFHFDTASIGNISLDLNVPQLQYLLSVKVLFPALEFLYLESLNEIEKIWHDDQLLTVSCGVQNLTYLRVRRCHKLKCAFTSSMVENFVHLKTLFVYECDEMEDIIEGILGGEENNSISVFPKLDSVVLIDLPNLKRFCCGINPIEFPFLRELEILKCPDLSAFHFDTASIGNNISLDPNIPQPQYLFSAKVVFPVLEELDIFCVMVKKCLSSSGGMKNVEMLWPNLLDEHSYSKLTSFSLEGCPKLLNVFPLSMLTRLQKLEKLKIRDCESLEEIICESQSQEVNAGAMQSLSPQLIQLNDITFEFPCLASLTLIDLPNLKSICHKTQTINWPLLKKMKVYGCHRIIKIITHSTAKSLVHLKTMRIMNCQEIEEIVCGGDDDDKISFPQLNRLELISLPKLESFCSSWHYTFGFPSLETVDVGNCPNMKTFSHGELNTPVLREVSLVSDEPWEVCWEGNLNSTIQQIFKKQIKKKRKRSWIGEMLS